MTVAELLERAIVLKMKRRPNLAHVQPIHGLRFFWILMTVDARLR